MNKQVIEQKECSECGNKDVVYDPRTGEVVCAICGYVLEENNMSHQRPRAYSPKEYQERYHAEVLGRSGTQLGIKLDERGRYVPLSLQMRRLQKQQRQAYLRSTRERNLGRAKPELKNIVNKLHLPSNVEELALTIYKMALGQKLTQGRSITCSVTASIYFACRLTRIQRPLSDFSSQTSLSKKQIAKTYRFLNKELSLKLNQKFNIKVKRPSYFQIVERITGSLQISVKTTQIAIEIVKAAEKNKITHGRSPEGIAVAAIYIACVLNKENKNQKEITHEIKTTEVTLRNRYKEMRKKLLFEIAL